MTKNIIFSKNSIKYTGYERCCQGVNRQPAILIYIDNDVGTIYGMEIL